MDHKNGVFFKNMIRLLTVSGVFAAVLTFTAAEAEAGTYNISAGSITVNTDSGGKQWVTVGSGAPVEDYDPVITGTYTFHGNEDQIPSRNKLTLGSTGNNCVKVTFKDLTIDISGFTTYCSNENAPAVIANCRADITLEGTNTLKGGSCGAGLNHSNGGLLTIKGPGTLKAYGGHRTSNPKDYAGGTGIGGNNGGDGQFITIESGTVYAEGGPGCAGIGGGKGTAYGHDIEIKGGNVTAIGGVINSENGWEGAGAGIGGAGGKTLVGGAYNIRISGGTVYAEGGAGTTNRYGAAGIGCGGGTSTAPECHDIEISGGTVKAVGGNITGVGDDPKMGGAGIGSGATGSCYGIRITGGNVYAIGGKYQAAIGKGKADTEEDIIRVSLSGNLSVAGGTGSGAASNVDKAIEIDPDGTAFDPSVGYTSGSWMIKYYDAGTGIDAMVDNTVDPRKIFPPGKAVTLSANGGSLSTNMLFTNSQDRLDSLPTPLRGGHDFLGWFTSPSGGDPVSAGENGTVFDSDTTIYAHWELCHRTISFNSNPPAGKSATVSPRTEYTTDGTGKVPGGLPTAVCEGYTFNGWWTSDGVQIGPDTVFYEDAMIYAHWVSTVTFDAGGGSVTPSEKKTDESFLLDGLPEPVWEKHYFLGWFTSPSGGDRKTGSGPYNENITLYAHWQEKYFITFNGKNGGAYPFDTLSTNSSAKLDALPASDPSRHGYDFNGWYTSESGGNKITAGGSGTLFSSDTEVYARWSEVRTGDISISVDSITIPYDGRYDRLTAVISNFDDLLDKNREIRWKSDNESIAAVDRDGRVYGKKVGETRITAEAGTAASGIKRDTCIVRVTKADPVYTPPTPIKGQVYEKGSSKKLINYGETGHGTFYYTVTKTDSPMPAFDGESGSENRKWKRSVSLVLLPGTYRVYYYLKGDNDHNDVSGYCDVPIEKKTRNYAAVALNVKYGFERSVDLSSYVEEGGEIELFRYDYNGVIHKSFKYGYPNGVLTLYIDPDRAVDDVDVSGNRLSFSVSDNSALSGEERLIEMTVRDSDYYKDYNVFFIVRISDKSTQIIYFDQKQVILDKGESAAYPVSGNKTPVRYESSDENVATVDDNGTVTAVGEGSAVIKATATEDDDYSEAAAEYTVSVTDSEEERKAAEEEKERAEEERRIFEEKKAEEEKKRMEEAARAREESGETGEVSGNELPDKVPLIQPEYPYPSSGDNFAPVVNKNSIKDLVLDFSRVKESKVDPSDLKVTVIKGSRFTTAMKLLDAGSISSEGGIRVKVNKNTLIPKITCKSDGYVTLTMENGNTYTVDIKVDSPKANSKAKKISLGSEKLTENISHLFGTSIDSGELKIMKQKGSQAEVISGNSLIIDPQNKDSIKIQYRYLNKKYKMTLKIK